MVFDCSINSTIGDKRRLWFQRAQGRLSITDEPRRRNPSPSLIGATAPAPHCNVTVTSQETTNIKQFPIGTRESINFVLPVYVKML